MSNDTQAGAGAGQDTAAGAGGGQPDVWYKDYGLDDDARAFIAGKGTANPADAIKSWMHADKIARERNVLEAPDATKINDWKGWQALGWEPDAAKYAVDLPETAKDLGELADGYKGFHDHLVKQMHANRVPMAAAKAIASEIVAFNVAQLRDVDAAAAREKSELDGALRREWGQSFDANREVASRAMRTLGVGEADAAEMDALLGSPRMVKLFHKLGQQLGEDRLVSAKGGSGQGADQARAAKAALEADPVKRAALLDAAHPQHAAVTAERERLQKIIFADAA